MPEDCVLITGVGGFIGSHLADRLLADGHRVVGVDNFCDFYDPRAKKRNLIKASDHAQFQLIEADIRDPDAMAQLFVKQRPATIMHLAAMAGVRPSLTDPQLYFSVNVMGSANLLEAAVKQLDATPHFIFASSSSVYGNSGQRPFREHRLDQPISPYAATKAAGELLCQTYHHTHGLSVTCLRLFTVFGPRQRPDLAICKFLKRQARNESIEMFGDGSSSRDYTYIDDIIDGLVASMSRTEKIRIYNLGGDHPTKLSDLIKIIEDVTQKKTTIEQKPMQTGDVNHTWADISRARDELGFAPKVSLEEGITRQWRWLRETSDSA